MAPASASNARPGNAPSGRATRQDDAIVEAAWCYYHESLTQSEIALRLGVSRASVVNYLAEARRRNYVRITLDTDIFHNHRLAHELTQAFGLSDVLIVPADQNADDRNFERVVHAASDWLPQLLEPGDHLGVAWGETIYRVAKVAPKQPIDDLTIVQLLGSKPAEFGFAAENCAASLADRFRAKCVNLHVPLLLSNYDLAEQLKAEPAIAYQLRLVDECKKVIFACGTFDNDSHIAHTGLVDKETMAEMRARGATGVICGRVIDQTGNPMPLPNEARTIGVTLDQMRNKEMRILVSAGSDRVAATRAALLGGYASHMITSSDIAQSLLQSQST